MFPKLVKKIKRIILLIFTVVPLICGILTWAIIGIGFLLIGDGGVTVADAMLIFYLSILAFFVGFFWCNFWFIKIFLNKEYKYEKSQINNVRRNSTMHVIYYCFLYFLFNVYN